MQGTYALAFTFVNQALAVRTSLDWTAASIMCPPYQGPAHLLQPSSLTRVVMIMMIMIIMIKVVIIMIMVLIIMIMVLIIMIIMMAMHLFQTSTLVLAISLIKDAQNSDVLRKQVNCTSLY